jgi:hypothetical protein
MPTAHQHFDFMKQELNEKQWRHYLGSEALRIGPGGINQVMQQSGADWKTIKKGILEIQSGDKYYPGKRIRKNGGGRKNAAYCQPKLEEAIELEAGTKTDKWVIVKWTSHSVGHITQAIRLRGFIASFMTVYRTLKKKGYALKANKKDLEGGSHPDRDKQFRYINMMGLRMQIQGFPILSIDAKKTEKIGNLKNNGKEWMAPGQDTKVNVYDYGEKDAKGRVLKAIPYGVYDVLKKLGFINVGIDHNTAEFAGASLIRYWENYGKITYPEAAEILFFADSGSSNGIRTRLWKVVPHGLTSSGTTPLL